MVWLKTLLYHLGIWILAGVIVFGCETNKLANFYGQVEDVEIDGLDLQISVGLSLVLSTIAAIVGLVVCLPILITDIKALSAQGRPQMKDEYSCQHVRQVQTRGTSEMITCILPRHPPRYSELYITPEQIATRQYPVGYPLGCVESVGVAQPPPYCVKPPQYTEKPCKTPIVESTNIPICV